MTLEQLAQFSNYAIASATGILALAFVAYVAQWSFARKVAPDRELVTAGSTSGPLQRPRATSSAATWPAASASR